VLILCTCNILNLSGSTLILGYLGVTAAAGYVYFLTWKKVRRDEIEMRSAKLALTPLLMAERDREYVI
jgi:NADH dehydrogenase (ubiquinone) 1 alpha subcomplex subunit 13